MKSKSNLNSNNNLKYKTYLDERKLLVNAKLEESMLLDKSILTLAAGAFGLSLTFIRQIAPNIRSGTVLILALAWVNFGISMLSTLISFKTSEKALLRQIEIIEADYLSENRDRKNVCENKPACLTKCLNTFSIVTFIVGTILLTFFSIFNLLP